MGYILIADDDIAIAELIADSLTDEGYATRIVTDGESALWTIKKESEQIDLILLDIMMPHKDGLEICMEVRAITPCPIVFVSAKSSDRNRILGLDIGADDYITKPFIVAELVARVNAHVRREKRKLKHDESLITLGDIVIDKQNGIVKRNGLLVDLSTREFQVFSYLVDNMGKVLSREQIFENVWGNTFGDLNSVTIHIKNIRGKLDPDNQLIRTVWGVGYRLVKGGARCL
ncbi:response regulator transcription factor [Cellulosilyticum sp. I15G10I2]|uniref:response regulator transcription factor n=1 Tax=Cellulosilyticum sp. I15G10I2 TaxID=1892843 RepID=UPI00085BECC7|nr:response regulator transcription factor [Cellulosilyticum sp. I15G10I2]